MHLDIGARRGGDIWTGPACPQCGFSFADFVQARTRQASSLQISGAGFRLSRGQSAFTGHGTPCPYGNPNSSLELASLVRYLGL